jgi:Ca2+-binding RTX toxin-like protein
LSNFWSLFNTAFGSSYDSVKAATFKYQWQTQDFSLFPKIEIVSGDVLGTANGAYASSNNTIYLSEQFLATASQESLVNVILEEFGHFVDAQVNSVDSAGDEGAIFAALVQGVSLSISTLQALKAEDDHGTITVNGEVISVEQQNFTGTNGNDNITGTSGNDTISPLRGIDNVDGGAGTDLLIVDYSSNTYSGTLSGIVSTNSGRISAIEGSNGVFYAYYNLTTYDQVAFNNIEQFQITGTGVADTIYTDDGNDTISSGAGDDIIDSGAGNDTVNGGAGNDYIYSGTGDDTVNGGDGTDALNADSISTGDGNDTISSGAGNDIIDSGAGNDIIDSGAGNDIIYSGTGDDTVNGGNGTDTLNDDFSGSNSNLTFDTTGITLTIPTGSSYSNVEAFNLTTGSGNDTIKLKGRYDDFVNTGSGNDSINLGLGQDGVDGGAGTDLLIVDYSSNTYSGTLSGIVSTNSGRISAIEGSNGVFYAYYDLTTYDQVVFNNIEQFQITGTGVADTIYTDDGNDTVNGGAGNDIIYSGAGNDIIDGGVGNDYIYSGTGDDTVNGGDGTDTLNDDSISTGDGNDTISSGDGDDIIDSGAGNDIIDGVNGTALSPGLSEIDNLSGGTGSDRFILGNATKAYYDDGNALTSGSSDYADITDFNIGDIIQLQGSSSNYLLSVVGTDTQILINKPSTEPDELIGIVRNQTGLNLTGSNFAYVTLPNITLTVAPSSVLEDGTPNLIYTFTRTGAITNALTVNYGITGTATNGTDYATIGTSVNFAANSATATVTVNPTVDTTIENNETVALTLATGTSYTIGTTTAVTGTITNDDGPTISLGLNYSAISEDSPSNFIYTFTRTGATTNSLTVNYSIAGTALSTDYTGATPGISKTITFAAGSATATLTLDPTADTTLEPNETVILQLVSGTGYTIVTTAAQTATIINDDNTRNQQGTNGNSVLLGKNYSDYLTGGTGNDILNGAGNSDYLTGAAGNDTLTGGSGGDTFFFANANLGIDTITDFTPNEDTIFISASGFGSGLIAGNPLTQTQFILGSSATSASQRFIYNSTNGALLFDADGNGLGTAKQIATLSIGLALTCEDIFVG